MVWTATKGESVVDRDIPIESPNKYGRFDDDLYELVNGLAGRDVMRRNSVVSDSQSSQSDTLDEDFLRSAGNPRNHYGE